MLNDSEVLQAIRDRLERVLALETHFASTLEMMSIDSATDPAAGEAFARMSALAAGNRKAVVEIAGRRGAKLDGPEPAGSRSAGERAVSVLLEDITIEATGVVAAYGALYATARILSVGEVCDLANAHATSWRQQIRVINDLMVSAVHGELLRDGLTCRCICPGCGIGVCLCTRNSIETVRGHWGQPGLDPAEGIELRIPPRPGSQLANAGLDRGDRVMAIDGEVVHTNSELQTALRRHPVGEAITMQVFRGGMPKEIRVTRLGDLPPSKSP